MLREPLYFPASLTAEEKHLKEMHERLKNLRKILESSRRLSTSDVNEKETVKRKIQEAEVNTEELRRKIASGEITVKKVDDKGTFKRSKGVEKRARLSSDRRESTTEDEGLLMSPTGRSDTSRGSFVDDSAPSPSEQLYIRGVALTEPLLENLFSPCGTVKAIDIDVRFRSGFVWMSSAKEAEDAIKKLDQSQVEGWTLHVSFARRPRPPPLKRTLSEPFSYASEIGLGSPPQQAPASISAWQQATTSRSAHVSEKRTVMKYDGSDDVFS